MKLIKVYVKVAQSVIDKILIYWQKACIPTMEIGNCIPKIEWLYDEW